MKIRPIRTELFHSDRHDGSNSRFPNFANTPKNACSCISTPLHVFMVRCPEQHYLRKEVSYFHVQGPYGNVKQNFTCIFSPEAGCVVDHTCN